MNPHEALRLVDLPLEVLEAIVEQVDRPTDLLSLGLSCRTLLAVTIPYPLIYRDIWWPIHGGNYGQSGNFNPLKDPKHTGALAKACIDHLAEQPKRGLAVRTITVSQKDSRKAASFLRTVQPQDSSVLITGAHASIGGAATASGTTILASALRLMPSLKAFVWDSYDPAAEGPLWTALGGLPLEQLHFTLDNHEYPAGQGDIIDGNDKVVICISTLALGCQDLIELRIRACNAYTPQTTPAFDATLFLQGRWSYLRVLHFGYGYAAGDQVASFLNDHPTIEVLSIIGYDFDLSTLDSAVLPSLKALDLYAGLAPVLFSPLPSGRYRPISSLRFVRPSMRGHPGTPGSRWPPFLKEFASTLRILRYEDWEQADQAAVDWIAKAVPGLTHLQIPEDHVRANVTGSELKFESNQIAQIETWAMRFSLFRSLSVLSLGLKWNPSSEVQRAGVMHSLINGEMAIEEAFRRVAPAVIVREVLSDRREGITIKCTRMEACFAA